MSSPLVHAEAPAPRQLRHPAELPFFVFMVVLNVAIVFLILWAAIVLPFLPEPLKTSGVAAALRAALLGLLLLVPGLIVVRETQRAASAEPPSRCRPASSPTSTGPRRTSQSSWGCGGGRTSS